MPASHKQIFGGTSGWAYPTWRPGFYPKAVTPRHFLQHYAQRLNSVEVNYTFRALPNGTQMADWLASAPPPFRFSFKAPERITHRKRLVDCREEIGGFLRALEPARKAKQLGLLLFQLPPNFKPDLQRLEAFLSLPELGKTQVSFEFRHSGWFTEECYGVLRRHNAALCIAETKDLNTPEVHTAHGFVSFRLRRPGGYSEVEAQQHAGLFAALAKAGREVYAYYMHEDEPHGPLAAEAMLGAAAKALVVE